ncbi:hypothetical protein JCM12298_00230 [Desulfothermus naphthae]
MCDYSLILLKKQGSKEKIMESVDLITKNDKSYIAQNIFGEKKEIRGHFVCFDGSKNEILFQEE